MPFSFAVFVPGERGEDLVRVRRLRQVADRPLAHRVDRRRDAPVAGQHEDARRGILPLQLAQQLEPAPARHPEVEHRHLGRVLRRLAQRLLAAAGGADLVAARADRGREALAQHLVVVHEEDARKAVAGHFGLGHDVLLSADSAAGRFDPRLGPGTGTRGDVELAAELLGERAGQEETEPHPISRSLRGEERLADAGEDLGGHAGAAIPHGGADPSPLRRDLERDLRVRPRGLQRVLEQAAQRVAERARRPQDGGGARARLHDDARAHGQAVERAPRSTPPR